MNRFRSALVSSFLAGVTSVLAPAAIRGSADAQSADAPRLPTGTISGAVLDADSGHPLAGAAISLQADAAGALSSVAHRSSSFIAVARSTLTEASGRYRLRDLTPGRYVIHVERTGYRSTSVIVDLRGSVDSRLTFGLQVEPIPLQSLTVTISASDAFGHGHATREDVESVRRTALRVRQRESLSTDAREITHADVVGAITLGEADLFRALQRLPGISTRDDYAAELWMRGAPWDHTRVYFDGLPLFNALHAVGAFTGISSNAAGATWVHPGVRSASIGEGGAGVVDIRSRRGSGEGKLNALGELSLVSLSLSLDQQILEGRGAWMLSGRRSYLDWLTRGIGWLAEDPSVSVPYAFGDLTSRFDFQLDEQRTLIISGTWVEDWLREVVGSNSLRDSIDKRKTPSDGIQESTAQWGNSSGRVSLDAPVGNARARHTIGWTRYRATAGHTPEERLVHSTLHYAVLGSEVEPRAGANGVTPWRAGYQFVFQSAEYDGPRNSGFNGESVHDRLRRGGTLPISVAWAERNWMPQDRLTVQAGLRLETGSRLANTGMIRPAPRITTRYQLHPLWAISAGAGRTFQYTQALAPAAPRVGLFSASHIWLLAGEDTPAIRADLGSLGMEGWVSSRWLASANAYLRRTMGVAASDPSPGEVRYDRQLFLPGENFAHGVELSARRMSGPWTASIAYTFSASDMQVADYRFPAAQDRRHSFDATALLHLAPSLRVGGAYTAATGAPYTRVYPAKIVIDAADVPAEAPARVELPNAERSRSYASLDVLVDWQHQFRSWNLVAYLQVRNALGRNNPAFYRGSKDICAASGGESIEPHDDFSNGIPRLPLLGVRVRF
ncbi:TonB-dependent receptor [soil metagenome]